MGIISKKITVKWNNKNKYHYINLGYEFIKTGEQFEVDINDLSCGSHAKIKCKCDCCNKLYDIEYCNFVKNNVDGKYFCNKCAKEMAKGKELETKLKDSKTFEQWCIENNKIDCLKLWDYGLNKVTPSKISYKSGKCIWFKCSCGKHESYNRRLCATINYDFRCPKCSRERKESMIQEKVRVYLEELGYTILHENYCNIIPINPKTKHPLPFDNEVEELKLIVEVHGNQHYNESVFTQNTDELHYLQLKDRYKKIRAIQSGYEYLEVPFYADNSNEDWKNLIDNKINDINAKKKSVNIK